MNSILETTASWVRPHLTLIAFTFVCTLLVLYGNESLLPHLVTTLHDENRSGHRP